MGLFFAYLDSRFPGEGYDDCAVEHINNAILRLAEVEVGPDLFSGVSGIAWAAEHVQRMIAERDGDGEADGGGEGVGEPNDLNRQVDQALADLLEQSPWEDPFDIVSGLAGIGVYLLSRIERPKARQCFGLLLDRLEELAEKTEAGVTWRTSPELLLPFERRLHPEGYYNLGMAHGVPGIIALLAAALEREIAPGRVRPLLDGAVRWLVEQKLPRGSLREDGVFPYFVAKAEQRKPGRMAWCYGDLGVSLALAQAARALDSDRWMQEALSVAEIAATRGFESSGVVSAGFCHGAAGAAHLFNRLAQATGAETMRQATLAWVERLWAYQRAGEGLERFVFAEKSLAYDSPDHQRFDLLNGPTGVALTLLALATDIEPLWDRMFLISISPSES